LPVDISTYNYLPLFSVRRAEMFAMENLPNKDKDILLPIVLLRGWGVSKHLENSIERIKKSTGDRPWIMDIDVDYLLENKGKERPVFEELESLRNSAEGYKNWCNFVAEYPQVIPCVQLEDRAELNEQLDRLVALGRGMAVRFNDVNIPNWNAILRVIAGKAIEGLCVIIDYGKLGQLTKERLLEYTDPVSTYVNEMYQEIPNAIFVVSSTTFPSDFSDIDGLEERVIFERQFFSEIVAQCPDIALKYSDRGSTRAGKAATGGATPAPRIDFPLKNVWKISRKKLSPIEMEDEEERKDGYRVVAKNLVRSVEWDPNLKIWGAKEIEASAKGELITNPHHSTAVRINIHLHRQLHYNNAPGEIIDTDDDWVD
jgi:Beta protein